jgi:hypothetical protein
VQKPELDVEPVGESQEEDSDYEVDELIEEEDEALDEEDET